VTRGRWSGTCAAVRGRGSQGLQPAQAYAPETKACDNWRPDRTLAGLARAASP